MRRNAPTVLALVLIVATATAFAVTQRLKLEPSPISRTRVSEAFSPVCRCASRAANIEFSLRREDDRSAEPDPRRHDQAHDQVHQPDAEGLPPRDGEAEGDLHGLRASTRA